MILKVIRWHGVESRKMIVLKYARTLLSRSIGYGRFFCFDEAIPSRLNLLFISRDLTEWNRLIHIKDRVHAFPTMELTRLP